MSSNPLKSIEELFNCKTEMKSHNKSRFPLINSKNYIVSPKIIVCHDLKGGYLQDRFRFGSQYSDAYRFWNWCLIDAFIYFSHNFVTIPPTGWVDAAHKNNTRILGTIITEFDEGERICNKMFSSKEMVEKVVNALVDVSQYFGFDGWLLNIENKLEVNVINLLNQFISKLTSRMHSVNENSLVIWYDSVTINGTLDWQNELNEKNRLFFDSCDGIYLNYGWSEDQLTKSRMEAGSRNLDVYAGIDVFARGCVGGFDSIHSIEKILKNELSVAIFGQSWTYECFSKSEYISNETKFWNIIECNCPRKILYLPFRTYFCQGAGDFYRVDGQIVSDKPWYNVGLQEVQPIYSISGTSTCLSDAFVAGSCTQIKSSSPSLLKLFNSNIAIHDNFQMTIVYKFVPYLFDCDICLVFEENGKGNTSSFSLSSSIDSMGENSLLHKKLKNNKEDICLNFSEDILNNGWISRTFFLSGMSNLRIVEIDLSINEENSSNMLLGYFEISSKDHYEEKKTSLEFQIYLDVNNAFKINNPIFSHPNNRLFSDLVPMLSISWISRDKIQEFVKCSNNLHESLNTPQDISITHIYDNVLNSQNINPHVINFQNENIQDISTTPSVHDFVIASNVIPINQDPHDNTHDIITAHDNNSQTHRDSIISHEISNTFRDINQRHYLENIPDNILIEQNLTPINIISTLSSATRGISNPVTVENTFEYFVTNASNATKNKLNVKNIFTDFQYIIIKPNDEYMMHDLLAKINRFHIYVWANDVWKFAHFSPLPYFILKWIPNDLDYMFIKLEILMN